MRDHGGNLDQAIKRWGGSPSDWIDLSTGINPRAYPVSELQPEVWAQLPTTAQKDALIEAARELYRTELDILPVAGAQAAIQMIPYSLPKGCVRILGPTYNEHAGSFQDAGWTVETVETVTELAGADVAVVVNPNNPDGRSIAPDMLLDIAKKTGLLIVDESFCDPEPGLSLAGMRLENVLVLRSFGKFFGLAGVRLGFCLGPAHMMNAMRDMAGPWPVSGPALEIGQRALQDLNWQRATMLRLKQDAARLDKIAQQAGWDVVGGTDLFRLYACTAAQEAQAHLAKNHIWSRIFPYSQSWIRLGLPDGDGWKQLEAALA